jgi:hypothetical protein
MVMHSTIVIGDADGRPTAAFSGFSSITDAKRQWLT